MTTDPRIAVLSALSSPGWHPIPEAHGMPWDEAEQLLAAYDASRAAVAPATDQTTLRDRIRRVLCERDGQGALWGTDMLEPDEYGADADAVLAVLPASTDRAAVLREAADFVGNDDECDCGGCDTCIPRKLAAELRRMAAESVPAIVGRADNETQDQTDDYERTTGHLITCFAVAGGNPDPDCPCAAEPPAGGAQQPETEAPCCSDPTCRCTQVNAAGRCDCANWDSAPAVQQPKETRP